MKIYYFLFILLLILSVGCSKEQTKPINEEKIITEKQPEEVINMAKALFIVAPNNFKDEEYFTPKEVLEENGIKVVTCSLKPEAVSVKGKKAKVDVLLDKATSDYDAIVFIGGPGASIYFENAKAHGLAKEFNNKGKIVAAICIAPVTLANAGVLEGKEATVWNGDYVGNLEEKGATYTGEDVTVDGNIITANGPGAAEEFGNKLVEALK